MTSRIVINRIARERLVAMLGRGFAILPLLGITSGCSPNLVVGYDQNAAAGRTNTLGGSTAAPLTHAGGSALGGTSSQTAVLGGQGGVTSTLPTSTGGSTSTSDSPATGNGGGTTTASGGTTTASGGTTTASGGTTTASGGTTTASGGTTTASGGTTTASGGTTTGGKAGSANAGGSATGGTSSVGAGGIGGGTPPGVTVNLAQTKQEMAGFGINNNWAPGLQDKEADELFNTTGTGIGLTILRIGMGSDGGHFNTNSPADVSKAKARGIKYIIGSTWSPPANCKSNNSENDGGHVLESCYASWSDKLAKFAKDNGLYAMSIGNEPDFASCGRAEPCNGNYATTLYTANELVKFIKVAGPKLQAAGVKVIAPEASEWIHNWSNESATGSEPGKKNSSDPLKCGFPPSNAACDKGDGYDYGHYLYKDKDAWKAFDIMGVHQYDTQRAEPWPADVPEKKPVWQTEMSGVKWWPEQGPSSDIKNGVVVAGWIHDAVTVGEAAAWLWWWYKAYDTDDNEGLYLRSGTDTKRHYTLGNYSKFIRPGYTRVDITGNSSASVLLSAFKGSDGTIVVVAINKGTVAATVPITIAGGTAPASMTPWVTSATDNLKSGTAVPVISGSFTATLGATTVTTFVGK